MKGTGLTGRGKYRNGMRRKKGAPLLDALVTALLEALGTALWDAL
jgi:hypothetical protein